MAFGHLFEHILTIFEITDINHVLVNTAMKGFQISEQGFHGLKMLNTQPFYCSAGICPGLPG